MNDTGQPNHDPATAAIRRLVDVRLKARLRDINLFDADGDHLDEDLLNAFIEGRLDEIESRPVAAHLVSCVACLHFTAQLIRADAEMEEIGSGAMAPESPGPLQRFFDRLAGGVPSMTDDVVFAYEDKPSGDKATEPKASDPAGDSQKNPESES